MINSEVVKQQSLFYLNVYFIFYSSNESKQKLADQNLIS